MRLSTAFRSDDGIFFDHESAVDQFRQTVNRVWSPCESLGLTRLSIGAKPGFHTDSLALIELGKSGLRALSPHFC